MKKLFIYISVCLAVISYCGCKKNKGATTLLDNALLVTSNTTNNNSTNEENNLKSIAVFSKCTNYDNKLSTVASEVYFIPLDDEPVLDDSKTYDVELDDDFIFLLGIYHIYQYNRQGRFIRQIGKRGMGPADYINISPPLQINYKEKSIYASDINRKRVVVYNFDGTFNRAFQTNFDFSGCMAILDSENIAFRQTMFERFIPNVPFISLSDHHGENARVYYSHLHPLIARSEMKSYGTESSMLWEHKGLFFYLEYGADTIFQITGDSFVPVWVLTGELKVPKKELFFQDHGKNLQNYSYILHPNSGIFESSKFLIFRLVDNQNSFYMVYDKTSGTFHRTYDKNPIVIEEQYPNGKKVISIMMDYFVDDLVSGLLFTPKYQSMGKAISLIPATTIVENRDKILRHLVSHPSDESARLKSIVEKMGEDDNPLLMIVTFK